MLSINIKNTINSDIIIDNFIEKNTIASLIATYCSNNHLIIIADSNLQKTTIDNILKNLTNNAFIVNIFYIKAKETNKSIDYLIKLTNKLSKISFNKNTTIVAIGGGMVLDLVGFVASIVMRGLDLIYIPTTLLAMVDSSIGGKNGINSALGKNSLGNFYQPKAILIDSSFLQSLPKVQLYSGFFECLKYGILFDRDFFNYLIKIQHLFINGEIINYPDILNNIIIKSCKFKVDVVNFDEKEEKNHRQLLNLGHTLGHALESYTNYKKLLHGFAVGIGIYYIAKLSNQLNLLSNTETDLITSSIDIKYLSKTLPKIDIIKLIKLMQKDKKNTNDGLNLVLVNTIGNCQLKKHISIPLVQSFLQKEFKN
jgi:3-dehydroquinate synthase